MTDNVMNEMMLKGLEVASYTPAGMLGFLKELFEYDGTKKKPSTAFAETMHNNSDDTARMIKQVREWKSRGLWPESRTRYSKALGVSEETTDHIYKHMERRFNQSMGLGVPCR